MNKFRIANMLCIEFIDSVFSPITTDNIRFDWLNGGVVLNKSEEFALAIILQNTYLYNTYLSMPNIFNALQDLNLVYRIDSDTFSRSFRRSMDKYPALKATLKAHTQRGYRLDYEKIDTTNGRLSFIESICFNETTLIAITGVGGSGKTYIANCIYKFFANRSILNHNKKSVFSVIFSGSLNKTLLLLDIYEEYDEETRLRLIREHIKKNTELLIIDNAILSSFTNDEIKFLKSLKNSSVRVILTTRVLPERMKFIKEFEIPDITIQQATNIFNYYYEYTIKEDRDIQIVNKIIEKACGNLLVIELLAKTARLYIRRDISLSAFLSFLDSEGFNFPDKDLINTDRWDDMAAAEQISKLYNIRSEELNDEQRAAIVNFALCNLIPLTQKDIKFMLDISGETIESLFQAGWLSYENESGYYMHDTIKASVQLQYKLNPSFSFTILSSVFKNIRDHRPSILFYKKYIRKYASSKISILDSCIKYANQDSFTNTVLYASIGDLYKDELIQYNDAILAYKQAFQCSSSITECIFDLDCFNTVRLEQYRLLYELSYMLSNFDENEIDEALTYITKALQIHIHDSIGSYNFEFSTYLNNKHHADNIDLCLSDLNEMKIAMFDTVVKYYVCEDYAFLVPLLRQFGYILSLTKDHNFELAINYLRIANKIENTFNHYSLNEYADIANFYPFSKSQLNTLNTLAYLLIHMQSVSGDGSTEYINEAESILKGVVHARYEWFKEIKENYESSKDNAMLFETTHKDASETKYHLSNEECYHSSLSDYAFSLNSFAECMFVKGDYPRALYLYKEAIDLRTELNDSFGGNQYLYLIAWSKFGYWCALSMSNEKEQGTIGTVYTDLLYMYNELYELSNDAAYLRDLDYIKEVNRTGNYTIPIGNQKHFFIHNRTLDMNANN